ncbi:glycosyltransferase [Pseudomonas sp. CGJS7]|uniref:glycosyltransferase n=1 Tax=Pseudomonas sp. CGJS7 TaxID=3109348 RepID=UPI00300B0D81
MRVFVTNELHPFTAGGIGRVVANILEVSSPEERKRTLILFQGQGLTAERFALVYPDVHFMSFDEADYRVNHEDGQHYPPKWAFTNTEWHWRSVSALQALLVAERKHGRLGYVEFTDWGGMAFAATQHKLLGLGLGETQIAVRLHSTDAVISDHESRPTGSCNLSLFDIERKALADADIVVGQLPAIAEATRKFYSFDESDWAPRLRIHAPPVLLDQRQPVTSSSALTLDSPIVFSSKLQHIKRPDVFIRGCAGFLRRMPSYRGRILLIAHAMDDAYAERVKKLIPKDLAGRFSFQAAASQQERATVIGQSVCVFPNAWESFCLAAYEASLLGATCVLNESAVAFSADSPWVAGENCRKFDGTPPGLCDALEALFSGLANQDRGVEVVKCPADEAPWPSAAAVGEQAPVAERLPKVSVIVPHYNLGQYVLKTIDSALASSYPNLEIILVDDASTDDWSRQIIERLEQSTSVDFKVVRNDTNRGLAGTRNLALQHATGEYVLPLDADDLIHSDFIRLAVRALERNPQFGFVVPQTGFFNDASESEVDSGSLLDYALFHGEARYAGGTENRYSTATMLARTDLLRKFGYRADLDSFEDWDLYQRMVGRGVRCLVTNAVYFHYRRRADSMIHSADAQDRRSFHRHDLLRGKRMADMGDMPLLVLGRQVSVLSQTSGAALTAELEAYRTSETVIVALMAARFLQRRAPWLVALARKAARPTWRLLRRGRGH